MEKECVFVCMITHSTRSRERSSQPCVELVKEREACGFHEVRNRHAPSSLVVHQVEEGRGLTVAGPGGGGRQRVT